MVLMLEAAARRAKTEFLWSTVKTCGSQRELARIREYLENGIYVHSLPSSDPLQKSVCGYFPGLTSRPWHDPSALGLDSKLKPCINDIVKELQIVKGMRAVRPQWHAPIAKGGDWNVCYLHIMGCQSRVGTSLCPATTAVADRLPGSVYRMFFSVLTPGCHIKPHTDLTNTRLRMHLGLEIPPACSIRVGHEAREWCEGEIMLFDGSFEHEAWNLSDQPRWILIMDLWHPELTQPERRALRRLSYFRRIERLTRQKETQEDCHLFKQIKSASVKIVNLV